MQAVPTENLGSKKEAFYGACVLWQIVKNPENLRSGYDNPVYSCLRKWPRKECKDNVRIPRTWASPPTGDSMLGKILKS